MDVKDFIADTLIQIIAGVKLAQDYALSMRETIAEMTLPEYLLRKLILIFS
jgi:hypothetical protein